MADCRQCADFDWCAEHEDCGLFTPKLQTNADRIRVMSDEALADFLTDDFCELLCGSPLFCGGQCREKCLEWLKKENDE